MNSKHKTLVIVTLFVLLISLAFTAFGGVTGVGGANYSVGANEKVDPKLFPFAPSLLRYQPSAIPFTPPQTCAACHPQQYEEWTNSMHAMAWVDPVFQGELYLAIKAVGPDVARQCMGCHTPAAVVTGEVTGAGITGLSAVAMAGVSCTVCHSVSGHSGWETPYRLPGNASLILAPGRDGPDGPARTIYGPYGPRDFCGGGFHECVAQPLHRQSLLCASCHQVYNHETHTPLESTYREWRDGPYKIRGISCQDCHMVDVATFIRSADTFQKPQRGEFRHYFNAANFLLYSLAELAALRKGDQARAANARHKYEMAVARLQAAAELELTPIYREGQLAEIKVRVKNIRAGHNLPTSLTFIRQMWLELTVRDAGGKVVMTTGTLNEYGDLPPYARNFNSEGMNKNFEFAIDPWEVVAFSRHDTIPPRGHRDVFFGVNAINAKGPLVAEATLRFRQADQGVAHKLLAAVPQDLDLYAIYGLTAMPDVPVVDMVKRTITFEVQQ